MKKLFLMTAVTCLGLMAQAASGGGGGTVKNVESGTCYMSITEALSASTNGQTIQLLTNVTENVSITASKTNTLDLAGWVLNGKTGEATNSVIRVDGGLVVSDSNPSSVHYYKVATNGLWVWQADFAGTENYTFSVADGLQANGVATDLVPTTNDVIAVRGGAITGGTGTVQDSKTYGAGIYVLANGVLTVEGGTIVGNRVAGDGFKGGGIFIQGKDGGKYTLTNCAIVGNVGIGGGLYCNCGAYALTSCHVSYNHAPDGGGVYTTSEATADFKGVKIIGNVVGSDAIGGGGSYSGGGVFAYGALVMSECVVKGNSAAFVGGGLSIWETTALTNCIVANNYAGSNSGGISMSDANTITVKGGEISGNTTTGDGGGLFVSSADLGGSATAGCKATLIDVVLTGNSAANGGAVCQNDTSELLMIGCTVTNNTATTSGGGICKFGDDSTGTVAGKSVLIETIISGNTSGENGGGVYFRNATCLAAGTLVSMADGTTKAIEDVKEGDFVKTFDHEGGTNSTARVYLAYQGATKETPFTLAFDDGRSLSIVGCHDLLEQGSRKYVTITSANVGQYLGAKFYGEDGAWHTLTSATMGAKAARFFSIYTTPARNVYANGLLTVANDADFLLNLYELDENLKADANQLAADIAEYGLYAYEEAVKRFFGESVSSDRPEVRALYDDLNVKYFNLAVGKQLVSWEFLQKTFAAYFDDGEEQTSGENQSKAPSLLSVPLPLAGANPAEPTLDDFTVGALTLGAGAVITNNTAGGAKSNIYLVTAISGADSPIALTASHDGVCAGVSCSWGLGPFTTNIVSASDAALFTSDDAMYRVKFVADQLELTYLDVSFVPSSVDHTTTAVYVNGSPVEKTGESYIITSNETAAVVVYTAAEGFAFADGTTAKTNEITATTNPATADKPDEPGVQVGDSAYARVANGTCTIFGTGATWAKSEWKSGNPLKTYDAAITNLVVQDGVTALGANSFESMWYVRDVTLAASVTDIGDRTFKRCYGLTNVTSLATGASTVGNYAFSGCHSLQSLSFAGAASFDTQSYTLQAAIYMKDGGIPEVYALPKITVAGKKEYLLGKKTLGEKNWTDVTDFSDEDKKPYHFFMIEMR